MEARAEVSTVSGGAVASMRSLGVWSRANHLMWAVSSCWRYSYGMPFPVVSEGRCLLAIRSEMCKGDASSRMVAVGVWNAVDCMALLVSW
jgi:hypothetical protein